ncbi:MAG: transcription-repair coupling factor [Desulfofustis sp.]|jgi:transcription-repair coupling factor (superfamily II helicase)|nr:transcription-repair coupling factor [Desulfofustis sp.]
MAQTDHFITDGTTLVSGLRGSSPAWFSATRSAAQPLCCILPDEQQVAAFEQDLALFTDRPILPFPGYETPPYTPLSPDQQTTAARLSTLYRSLESESSFILVVSIEALLRRVLPKSSLQQRAELLMTGESFDLPTLRAGLIAMGYEHTSLVRGYGDFSVRGGVVDIFPPPFLLAGNEIQDGPLRLDFFGDTIESIRQFNPINQRSSGTIDEAVILPVSDILLEAEAPGRLQPLLTALRQRSEDLGWAAEQTKEITDRLQAGLRFAGIENFLPLFCTGHRPATVLDYLPDNTTLIMLEPETLARQARLVEERIAANYDDARRNAQPALPPGELFVSAADLAQQVHGFEHFAITDFSGADQAVLPITTTGHQLLKQEISRHRKTHGLLAPLADQIRSWQEAGEQVVVCCRSQLRQKTLAEMLSRFSFNLQPLPAPLDLTTLAPAADREPPLYLCDSPLNKGFSLPEQRCHLLSESELFGEMRLGGKKRRSRAAGEALNFTELQEGDIVVHREHGLGIYRGLVTMALQGITNDFMLIEYRDGDKLYLPVDRLGLVSRYEGVSDKSPKIDKLGAQSWKSTKNKVSEEVWKVAQELLDIYAARAMRSGRSFSPPGSFYQELEESFAFDETPGQYRAINETIDDLTSDKPMDRLICGDVGYGKTEVAIRAAFKVVEDGYQAAILVPTTVLAEQHAKTFGERLKEFPVRIECLNRFRSRQQQRQILGDLAAGSVDIVIGTHRLLSKDVRFANLGLLIIDEEHRFGVAHKEKIKKIKAEVDVLTLTATPIPRTLQLSLLGIRDLSVISTPPEHRRPIKTFVARYDDLVIKEAVSRELLRGGQVFIVHNRVKSIHRMAATVQKLVPEARIAVAHGQMPGKELEDIMVAFVNHQIDVLISTTIIESGLDIPSANTIIINRADRLGLAEIYQLRGRVGRSATQSFAYLLVPSLDHLSKESRERLRALMEYNELGGGFKLAMSDLQIRGGGNLLGVSQSGHIAAIGYDLYLDLLQKTVAELKARQDRGEAPPSIDDLDPEINLNISAYIPEAYLPDISQRYLMYRRIASLLNHDTPTPEELLEELDDRYGRPPDEVRNLFRLVAVKKRLLPLRVNKLERGNNTLVFGFLADTPVPAERLFAYVQEHRRRTRLLPDGRLIVELTTSDDTCLQTTIDRIIHDLDQLTHDNAQPAFC